MLKGKITMLGSFELESDTLRVSDPCYERDTWCCGTLPNCLHGTWEAAILRTDFGEWGNRNAALIIRHEKTGPKITAVNRALCNGTGQWHEAQFEVGVDSGQAGFFDEKYFRDPSVFPAGEASRFECEDRWYGFCCDATLHRKNHADVIPCGVVSESGFGDGGYVCYYHLNKDEKVDFAFILFLTEEDVE